MSFEIFSLIFIFPFFILNLPVRFYTALILGLKIQLKQLSDSLSSFSSISGYESLDGSFLTYFLSLF